MYRSRALLVSGKYYNDSMVPATSVRGGTTAPTFANEFGGVNGQWYTYFSGVQTDEVHFSVQIPHDYIERTTLLPHVHCAPVIDGSSDHRYIRFQLDYQWSNIFDKFGTQGTIAMVADTQDTDGTYPKWRHCLAMFTDTTKTVQSSISGEGKTLSSILVCKLSRPYTHADDTYNGNVAFLGFDFHYLNDGFGSEKEYLKK